LGKDILRKLERHYPGWAWKVEFPPGGQSGVVIIRHLDCDPRGKMGMIIKLQLIAADPALVMVERLAGEFLERYRLKRLGFRPELLDDRIMLFERADT